MNFVRQESQFENKEVYSVLTFSDLFFLFG